MSPLPELVHLGGHGPNVLLIHGYGSDRLSWVATSPALFEVASVWTLDLPGHGKSVCPVGDGSIAFLAACIHNALQHTAIQHWHLLGHSLGGRLAIQIALNHPGLIQSLALLAPAGISNSVNAHFMRAFYSAQDTQQLISLLRTLVHDPRMISKPMAVGVLQQLDKAGTRKALQAITDGLVAAQGSAASTLDALNKLDLPCISIVGEQDQINPLTQSLAEQFAGVTARLDSCGHLPHLEQRTRVNALLTDFYRSLTAA